MEIIALIAIFAGLPLFLYYGEKADWPFVRQLMYQDKWEMQKVLVIFTSFIALAVAALRTAAVFEKRRDKLLQKGKDAALKDFESIRKSLDNKSDESESPAASKKAAKAAAKEKKRAKKK